MANTTATIDELEPIAAPEQQDRFTIPVTAWADFTAKIAKLNKRAKRLGCEPITFAVIAEGETTRSHTFKTEDREYTKEYRVKTRTIELHGAAPKLEGHAFIAKIEYLSDGKSVLFHQVPGSGIKIDDRFRSLRPGTCEHCNKQRRRAETFVVMEIATGRQMQVGRNCLADFTGINSPQAIAAKASWLSSFTDLREMSESWWGGHFANVIDTHHVLSLTSAYIQALGWIPRSAAGERNIPTASRVGEHFFLNSQRDGDYRAFMRQIAEKAEEPEHQDRAKRVVAWIKTDLADRARSDYEMNLVTLVVNDLTEQKHLGIVCSAVAAYQKAMNQKVEYAKKKEAHKNSIHIGTIGERIRHLAVKIEMVRALEANQFGPRSLVKFTDTAGNVLTWFASGDRDYTPGTECKITATIKGHSTYADIRETQLSRVVIEEAAR